jgi:N-acetylglutamate synthase
MTEMVRNITLLEERSLNAWPALQTSFYDGWVLRFADGYTRRANSINPIYPSTLPLEEKIAFCERMYRDQGLPAVYKITPACQPPMLDDVLAACNCRLEAHTSVQCMDLRAYKPAAESGRLTEFSFAEQFSDEWLSVFNALSDVSEKHQKPMRQILSLLQPKHCFAMQLADDGPVACGLAVYQNGFVGLFDIVVAADRRRKGFGRCLMDGLLAWGIRQGAVTSYLQVMANNPPALQLYAGMGYREAYRYWYRVWTG